MEFLNKHPELTKKIESFCKNRRNEILSEILEIDEKYKNLCYERAKTSMSLKELLNETGILLLEKYSDSIYAQEVYELEVLYRQAVYDILNILGNNGLIK